MEPLLGVGGGVGVERGVVDAGRRAGDLAVVGVGVQVDDV